MKLELPKKFLLVDDDEITNMINAHVLKSFLSPAIDVASFTDPTKGIEFISNYKFNEGKISTVLFLDLNMPILSGWDFIELLNNMDKRITEQISLFILSSSVDNRDMERAKSFSIVKDYLFKPLTEETLKELF